MSIEIDVFVTQNPIIAMGQPNNEAIDARTVEARIYDSLYASNVPFLLYRCLASQDGHLPRIISAQNQLALWLIQNKEYLRTVRPYVITNAILTSTIEMIPSTESRKVGSRIESELNAMIRGASAVLRFSDICDLHGWEMHIASTTLDCMGVDVIVRDHNTSQVAFIQIKTAPYELSSKHPVLASLKYNPDRIPYSRIKEVSEEAADRAYTENGNPRTTFSDFLAGEIIRIFHTLSGLSLTHLNGEYEIGVGCFVVPSALNHNDALQFALEQKDLIVPDELFLSPVQALISDLAADTRVARIRLDTDTHNVARDRAVMTAALLAVDRATMLPRDLSIQSISEVLCGRFADGPALSSRANPTTRIITEELCELTLQDEGRDPGFSIPLKIMDICDELGINSSISLHIIHSETELLAAVRQLDGGEFIIERITEEAYSELTIKEFLQLFFSRRFYDHPQYRSTHERRHRKLCKKVKGN